MTFRSDPWEQDFLPSYTHNFFVNDAVPEDVIYVIGADGVATKLQGFSLKVDVDHEKLKRQLRDVRELARKYNRSTFAQGLPIQAHDPKQTASVEFTIDSHSMNNLMRQWGKKVGEGVASGIVNKQESKQRIVIEHVKNSARTAVFLEQYDPVTDAVQFRFQINSDIIKDLSVDLNPRKYEGDLGESSWSAYGYGAPEASLTLVCDIVTKAKP